jgi:amidohydrolase
MGTAIEASVDRRFDEMVDIRRSLHRHPELGFAEYRTTALVRDRLGALGLEELPAGTATGAVFELTGARPGRTVVLRADIDALPIREAAATPHRSSVDGVMHACGHDAHTAALVGVASVLASRAESLPGRYVFLFQPGEELFAGARHMVEGGVLSSIGPAWLVGHHVTSLLPVGLVGMRAGVAMSEAHTLRIRLRGVGGHAAMANAAGNVVTSVGRLLLELGGVTEGLHYEGTGCVCSAGDVRAGTAVNVAPEDATVSGTLRTFTDEQRRTALERLDALCERLGRDEGIEATFEVLDRVPAVVNDVEVTALVDGVARGVVGEDRVVAMPPVAPSDDVSELLHRLPGCYFFVGGARADGSSGTHHSPTFAIDEESIRVACAVMTSAAVAMASADTRPEDREEEGKAADGR